MFKNISTKCDINEFLNSLSPLFKFKQFEEKELPAFDGKGGYFMTYTAITHDELWKLEISFFSRSSHDKTKQNYLPVVKLKPMYSYTPSILEEKRKEVSSFFQTKYSPDYTPIMDVINTFIEQGLDSGLIESYEFKSYEKTLKSHFDIAKYREHFKFESKNITTISFYNILQKDNKDKTMSTKKSMITLDIVYLVDNDEKIKPYFKVKLPYSAQKKIIGIVPMNEAKVMYYTTIEDAFRTKSLSDFKNVELNNEALKDFFESQFKKEAETIVATKLNMEDMNLNELSLQELKEYFPLVEMLKI